LSINMMPVSAGLFGVVGTVNHGDEGVNGRSWSCVLGRVKAMPVPGRVIGVSFLALVG
jgi:hypothetical protein